VTKSTGPRTPPLLAAVGLVAIVSTSNAQSVRYGATPLAFPDQFVPRAMNSSRTIAGSYGSYEDGTEAAVWSSGVLTRLGSSGARYAGLEHINERGDAVGTRSDTGSNEPIRYAAGVLEPLAAPPAQDWGVTGINNDGVICGIGYDSHGLPSAMLWIDGNPVPLAPYQLAKANAINNRGEVAGTRLIQLQAVVWRPDGTLLELQRGDNLWDPRFINDAGLVAGDNGPNPILWDPQGQAREIIIPDHQWGSVAGLDRFGHVYGQAPRDDTSQYEAWMFDGVEAHILNDLVDGEWGRFVRVWAVSPLGELIVATDAGDYVLLTPVPGPASAWTLLACACCLLPRRRARTIPPAHTL
jgi:hypothetical protein